MICEKIGETSTQTNSTRRQMDIDTFEILDSIRQKSNRYVIIFQKIVRQGFDANSEIDVHFDTLNTNIILNSEKIRQYFATQSRIQHTSFKTF